MTTMLLSVNLSSSLSDEESNSKRSVWPSPPVTNLVPRGDTNIGPRVETGGPQLSWVEQSLNPDSARATNCPSRVAFTEPAFFSTSRSTAFNKTCRWISKSNSFDGDGSERDCCAG